MRYIIYISIVIIEIYKYFQGTDCSIPARFIMSRSYQRKLEYLEKLLEKGVNATAKHWIQYFIKNPHEIEFELLTSRNAGVWFAKTPAILQKWNNQGMFVQFLDGNTGNCSPLNLRMTSLPVILNHWDDEHWRTDWDLELNVSEIQLVLNPNWRHGLVMREN